MSLWLFLQKNAPLIWMSFARHLQLVGVSVGAGILVAVPLGVLLTRHKRLAGPVLALAGVVQTIPGLVMLGLALLVFGIGFFPAAVVLFLYAILPILRNTYTGITEVERSYIEAGRGIGMTGWQLLCKVELPLALSTIVGGIRISAVYIVSWATLAGLISAGGLGDLIWTGLSTYNKNYILAGTIPATLLAFALSGLIGLLQRALTPRGLRGGEAP